MPKPTFQNLHPAKKKQFINAFLREFSIKSYDNASISEVVKQLGIAKGSVYQYFDDKFDLFQFLLTTAVEVKTTFVRNIHRNDYEDFWAYFHSLFQEGIQFDLEHPLESHFLHNFSQNLHSPSIREFYQKLMHQSIAAFEKMCRWEVEAGNFRSDISIATLGYMLYKAGSSIQEQMEHAGIIDPRQSILAMQPIYLGKTTQLMSLVDEYILLLRPSFDKQKHQ